MWIVASLLSIPRQLETSSSSPFDKDDTLTSRLGSVTVSFYRNFSC